jgi:hypothetical protein
MGVATYSGLARSSVIMELISFFHDPFEEILQPIFDDKCINRFIANIFNMSCRLNHWAIIQTLIENEWSPEDVLDEVKEAIKLGHQKTLHVLLESLIAPDSQIETQAGVVPKIFRHNEILQALPMIARRFPQEIAWLLTELSNVPIPICCPRSLEHEPAVRTTLVKGIHLGFASMAEVIKIDPSVQSSKIWDRLTFDGQLRNASRRRAEMDYETESVICMAPEALVTHEAFHETGVGSASTRQTNALIRLLSTGEETIILKPVTQALMEFHWMYGKFWARFAAQFMTVVLSIASCAALFWFITDRTRNDTSAVYLPGISYATLCFSAIFLGQELRQFIDDPGDYTNSTTNILDLFIHSCVAYIAIAGGLLGKTIPVLLMAIILVLHATRLLLHLRIMPSVGPLVRITILASINILPILIPMGIMLFAFAGGFFLIQQTMITDTKWVNFSVAFQFVTTMITFDYSYNFN